MDIRTAAIILLAAICACTPREAEVSSSVYAPIAPVLALKDVNNIATINLDKAVSISEVTVALESTEGLGDLRGISILSEDQVVASKEIKANGQKATLKIPCSLTANSFGIGLTTADAVNMDNKLTIRNITVKTAEGMIHTDVSAAPQLRMGVALRMWGQDKVDNCRIPGLAITPKGTILAVYDARRGRNSDLQGDIDICYNRSTDGGRTWSEMKVAMDMGEWGGLPQKFNGISDPCILVDDNTGDIYVAACWMHGVIDKNTGKWVEGLTEDSKAWNHQWNKNGSRPGYDVHQSCQWMIVKSSDDGLTWSEAQNFTRQVKPENYCLMINSPGAGITLEDGTLVFPAQGKREDETHFSTLISSRDGGKSWSAGTPAVEDHGLHCNECMAVQLADGSIMLNMRAGKNRGNHERNGRLVYITRDLGQTWEEHPSSGHVLTEPTCQGTLHKHMYRDASGKEHELLLFFNPNDPDKRVHSTLKCSLDEGLTWPENMWLEVDEALGRGYSCMISIDNDTIGVLYEGAGACLIYQQIRISDFFVAPQTQFLAERLLTRWTDAVLALRIEEGPHYGAFDCPACHLTHGRIIDMVWPLTWLWQRTGNEKYLNAARDAIRWGEAHLQQKDGSYNNDLDSKWKGITEFSQTSLGKTLLRFGDVLPEDIAAEWKDLFLRQSEYIYNWKTHSGNEPNVNYLAARPLCMELAYRLTGEERFRKDAQDILPYIVGHIAPDGLFFGECHPTEYLSPRGLRGVDMGYNVEESLPLLLEYAEMAGDKDLLDTLMKCAYTHMDFLLPDGGLDNSFGTRSNKWTYWGSRTSDGILIMLSVLARHGYPEAMHAAELMLDLYERCTGSDGLLYGGLYYKQADEPACIHHSFCHIKPLPDWIDADFSGIGDIGNPLLGETAFGIRNYPSRGVHIIGTDCWRATINQADNWSTRETQTTGGGSLSLLYHRNAGLILAATSQVYNTDEKQNMQWQIHDNVTRSFTPRFENGKAISTYDKDAEVTVTGAKKHARVTVKGNLTDEEGNKGDAFSIVYSLKGDKLGIVVKGNGTFILPVICTPEDALEASSANKLTIKRDAADICINSNRMISMPETARPDGLAFNPTAGLMGAYLTIPVDGKATKITLKIN